jgi:hypothetical protein
MTVPGKFCRYCSSQAPIRVQVVGRLVEQQNIGLAEQQAGQCHAAAFAAGANRMGAIIGRAAQGIGKQADAVVEFPAVEVFDLFEHFALRSMSFIISSSSVTSPSFIADVFVFLQEVDNVLHAFFHDLPNGFGFIEVRLLSQVPDFVLFFKFDLAFVILVQAGNNFQQGRFTRAVETQNADFGAVEKRQPDIFEHLFCGGKVLETPDMEKIIFSDTANY